MHFRAFPLQDSGKAEKEMKYMIETDLSLIHI